MKRDKLARKMLWMGAVLALLPVGAAWAADEPTLDELLNLEPAAESADRGSSDASSEGSPETGADAGGGAASDDEAPGDGAGGDGAVGEALALDEAADVFEKAVAQMRGVSRRLGERRDAGRETQREQREILRKLDQLIASARQRQQKGGGSSKSRPEDPGSSRVESRSTPTSGRPQDRGEQAGEGDFAPGSVRRIDASDRGLEELREEWGSLPPRLRDELSEGLSEPFSPVYRELTESFYRRLGEPSRESR